MFPFNPNFIQLDPSTFLNLYREIQTLKIQNQNLEKALEESQERIMQLQDINEKLKTQSTLKIQPEQEQRPSIIRQKQRSKRRTRQNNREGIFECPYEHCNRNYGTSLALNLHIKLKHNGGSKKQRQKMAKKIIECEQKGQQVPKYYINFPPNYVQNYKLMMKSKKSF